MSSTYPADARTPAGVRIATDTTVTNGSLRRVSWGAIIAGMVVAISVQMVLSLLGAGIGLSTIDPLRYSSPDASSFGIGAGVWWAVSSIISLFAGGWVAGHLAGSAEKTDAMLHGLVTWGLAAIVTAYLLASAVGAVVRGGANVIGTAATVTASGAAAVAAPAADAAKRELQQSGISFDDIKNQAQKLLMQTGKPALQPEALTEKAETAGQQAANTTADGTSAAEFQSLIQRIVESNKDTVDAADRDAVVNVVVARSGLSKPEAEARVDGWIKTYQDARVKFQEQKAAAEAKAREVADATAKASSQAALAAVVALLLGALAAALGGMSAHRRYIARY
jgi:hypothetical protein